MIARAHLVLQIEFVCKSTDIRSAHRDIESAKSKTNSSHAYIQNVHMYVKFGFKENNKDDLMWWRSQGTVQLNLLDINPLRWSILMESKIW